jgi:hypothetical protein
MKAVPASIVIGARSRSTSQEMFGCRLGLTESAPVAPKPIV